MYVVRKIIMYVFFLYLLLCEGPTAGELCSVGWCMWAGDWFL